MTHGSLFSGIGGFDLAAEWMGWRNMFHCEIDPFCQKVLNYHFPNAKSYTDIKSTDFTQWGGQIDILSGGFPCQPFSVAGARRGTEDDRYLWDEMLRAIREITPRWVVGENVRGLISWNDGMVFDTVCSDLEAEGYEVVPFLLPACGVNAPHRRERVWFVAYSSDRGCLRTEEEHALERSGFTPVGGDLWSTVVGLSVPQAAADTDSTRRDEGYSQSDKRWQSSTFDRQNILGSVVRFGSAQAPTDANSYGLQRQCFSGETSEKGWEAKVRHTEESTGCDGATQSGGWLNFPTQSPVCSRDDGLSMRLDGITFSKWRQQSIKAYGNAIVPQVAYQIFKAIDSYELM